jgi:hypothetical protein
MSGNPKDSLWRSTPQGKRKRRKVQITLSDEACEKLSALIDARGGGDIRSQVVEELIMEATCSYSPRLK